MQYINTGTSPNSGNGDSLRLAFDKINGNFRILNNLAGAEPATTTSSGVIIVGNGITVDLTGTISAFDGDYANLTNVPQALGLTDSPTFAKVSVGASMGPVIPFTGIDLHYDTDAYTQVMSQNHNSGTVATSDLIIARNDGDQISNMIDIGINSTGYQQSGYSLQTPGSGYLFTNGADLFIGTQTPGTKLHFHAGGTTSLDSGGFLDAYAWNFNRSVNTTVSTPGALNFTVQNTNGASGASAIYQALNENNGAIIMGIHSSNTINGNILGGDAFIRTTGIASTGTLHIGNRSNIHFYANNALGIDGPPMLELNQNGNDAILDGHLLPYETEQYDLGSSTSTWRSLHLSTGAIYMGNIPIEMSTATSTLIVGGSELISVPQLKAIVAASADFADFQSRIAAL